MSVYPFYDDITSFTTTLDGERHTAYVEWNFAGERWYIRLLDSTGELIMNAPVIESTRELPLNMLSGYFANSIIFNSTTQAFEVD